MPILVFCSPGILNIERLQSCSCACPFVLKRKAGRSVSPANSCHLCYLYGILSWSKMVEQKQNMMIKSYVSWCCRGEFMKHSYLAVVSW